MHVLAKKRKEKNNKQTQAKAKATHTWVTIRQNYLEVGREEISGLSQNLFCYRCCSKRVFGSIIIECSREKKKQKLVIHSYMVYSHSQNYLK